MAGILKKIFGGFSHHHNKKEEKEKIEKEKKVSEVVAPQSIPEEVSSGRGGRGFSVQVAVPADPVVHAPVVSECNGDGGVQGLTWYAKELRADDDGDVAQEFLKEVIPESRDPSVITPSGFEAVAAKHTRPLKFKGPVCTQNGNVHIS
ncbi:uncharacterized protein [Physcomitrium patens]|uniref:Uncharacterized protein n=1 Tax=Physcomitrium patens TaxID=3218 RepID=A0A2K1JYY8_PHYPA|nr:uncharacterized protein LOC112287964 isoform X1 [Physcomitrium patens]PNR46730.1 hypothetical protein PHYPA_013850 [Physcomitrium patens]|eukprot:XP_024387435.1 uncharacterized protein LOC112287964 isoform X1 [Physcomitrella patens]